MHLCQRFFQSSKHLLNSISGIAFKAFFDSACISSIVSKRCPRSGFLSVGNSQKSHGAKSGENGRCGTICVEFLAKWSRRTSAVWDGALSWCKNHELSAQNIFFRVARQLMLMVFRGVPSHQHVLYLLWSLGTTYKHFSVTWSNHRRPSATFWTFPQVKFHSANKI